VAYDHAWRKGVDIERKGEKRAKETYVTQRERKKERAEMKEPFLFILFTFLLWYGAKLEDFFFSLPLPWLVFQPDT